MVVRGWWVVGAYSLLSAVLQVLWLTYAPFTTEAATRYGVSDSSIIWLANVFPLLYVVLAVPAGLLLDRWFRPTLLAAGALTAVGAAIRVGDTYLAVLVGQTVIALAQPFVLSAINTVCDTHLPVTQRPQGIAVAAAANLVGMLAALLCGGLLGADGLGALHLAGAVAAAGSAVALAAVLRWSPGAAHEGAPVRVGDLRRLLGQRVIRLLGAAVFLAFGLFVALTSTLEVLLAPHKVSAEDAGTILAVMVVAGALGSAVIPPWAAGRDARRAVLMGALTITVAGCASLAVVPHVGTGFIVAAVVGFPLLACLPLALELMDVATGAAGSSTGAAFVYLAGNAGGIVLTLMVDAVHDSAAAGFGLLALAAAGAGALASRLPRSFGAIAEASADPALGER